MPIAELVTMARMTECADGLTLGHDFHPVFPTPYSHYIPCPHPPLPKIRLNVMALVMGFTGGSEGKVSACDAGDLDSIPGSGRSPGEGKGNPLQYSCLENPMD